MQTTILKQRRQIAAHLSDLLERMPSRDREQAMESLMSRFQEADSTPDDVRTDNPMAFGLDLIEENEFLYEKMKVNPEIAAHALAATTPEQVADALL